jgi:hypothetical protein
MGTFTTDVEDRIFDILNRVDDRTITIDEAGVSLTELLDYGPEGDTTYRIFPLVNGITEKDVDKLLDSKDN